MEILALLLMLPILVLVTAIFLPSSVVNAKVKTVRASLTVLIGIECLLAVAVAIAYTFSRGEPLSVSLLDPTTNTKLGLSIYYDGATALMLALVSFVGLIVSRFSIRYLDGETMQGRYFRWLGFTVGAVSLMVVAGNLLLFFAAWVMTSFGLHQLLLHYGYREAARRAAWTKFAISRLGDSFLIAALILTFKTFGTLELSTLFESAKAIGDTAITNSHLAIAWMLVLGAVTKSAQFPFHTWLPDTMETPTPVSALMHAGIVNAGGYLIIRMSPLVALAPTALITLAALGAFTTFFAGVVMMTQPSVKRALAYSTIAQMGFMMLQCGLGAFSAAMLHIIAHSLYKAHAFLDSGTVVSQLLATAGAKSPTPSLSKGVASFLAASVTTVVAYLAFSEVGGLHATSKPGGLALGFILCLALTTWGWRVFTLGEAKALFGGFIALAFLCLTYFCSYLVVQHFVEQMGTVALVAPRMQVVPLAIAGSFAVLLALQVAIVARLRPHWLEAIRVHAVNGFYIENIYHRIFATSALSGLPRH